MDVNYIVKKILEKKKELSSKEVLEMIEEKRRRAGGFLTLESAARIVASDVGVNIELKSLKPATLISDLVPGLNDVTVAGRIIRIYPLVTFKKRGGEEGKLRKLLIADKSGRLNVVLWNKKATLFQDKEILGKIVKFSHGYVKETFDGSLELNIGEKASIEVSPIDVSEKDYPQIEEFTTPIGKIRDIYKEVNIAATIRRLYPLTIFSIKDGSEGKVRKAELEDSTGTITATFWNEKAEMPLKEGFKLIMLGAKIRKRNDAKLELHIEKDTNITIISDETSCQKSRRPEWRIRDFKPGMRNIDILLRIVDIGKLREFTLKDERKIRCLPLLVCDETGTIRLNLWDEKADFRNFSRGDLIRIKGATISGKLGRLTLNLGRRGTLIVNPNMKAPKLLEEVTVDIEKIADENGPITIEGYVLSKPFLREVVTNRGEVIKVATFLLGEGEKKIEVSLWRELAEEALTVTVGDKVKIRNAYVKRSFDGTPEITSGALTSMEKLVQGDNRDASLLY
ncbi:TPA: hypothetical protein EYP70_05620 [Candidatus Bathyarchaeota archaeon]|nr:hypothetical protein [Candidatus Bathyarchaeota archaeon]